MDFANSRPYEVLLTEVDYQSQRINLYYLEVLDGKSITCKSVFPYHHVL